MCSLYRGPDEHDEEELEAILAALQRGGRAGPVIPVRGDIAPTDVAPVIASSRRLVPGVFAMRWGYRTAGGGLVINARSETARERPLFAGGMQSRRCLIPAGWYYEWERRGRQKIRYAIRPEGEGLMYMAGLYRLEASGGASFVILTRGAVQDVAAIHPRMPVILPADVHRDWLNPRFDGRQVLGAALERMRFGAA